MTDQNVEKYVRMYHTMLYLVAFSYLLMRRTFAKHLFQL